jgi:hypothetical protein
MDSQIGASATVKLNSIIIHHAVNFAWATFKKHYGLLIAILLSILGAWIALEIVVIAGQRFGILWWIAAHLAFLVFFAGIEVGFIRTCFDLYNGEKPVFADIFRHLSLGLKFLAGQTLYLLMTVVGLVFFIIPGVYLGVRYVLFCFCLVAGEESLRRSFQRSAMLSKGNMTYLLAINGSLLVFNLLGACLLGIGLFITVPLSTLMMISIYKQLSELTG